MPATAFTQKDLLQHAYGHAADMLIKNPDGYHETVQSLIALGVQENKASDIVSDLQHQIISIKKNLAKKHILYGALWCVGGIIATVAHIGFIFWGAIIFGGIQCGRGLINYSALK